MDQIGATLGDDIDGGAGTAAELGLRTAGDRNFREGVNRKNGGGAAPDAGLIDRGQIAVAIVHVGAVEQVIVGAAAIAVEAEQSIGAGRFGGSDRIAGGAWDQFQKLGVVASVDRQLGGLIGSDGSAGGVGSGFNQRNIGGDLDGLLDLAGGELGVSTRRRSHVHWDLIQGDGLVALHSDGHAVGAERQFGGHVDAQLIGDHHAGQACAGAEDFYLCAGDGCSGTVCDGTLDASAEGLCNGSTGEDGNEESKE